MKRILGAWAVLALWLGPAACADDDDPIDAGPEDGGGDVTPGDDGGAETSPDVPGDTPGDVPGDTTPGRFTAPNAGTTYVYRVWMPGEPVSEDIPASYGPRELFNGREFRRLDLGDFAAADPVGMRTWTNYVDNTIEFGGAAVYQPGGTAGEADFTYFLDPPLSGRLDGPVGVPSEATSGGRLEFAGGGSIDPWEITVTFTLVSTDETITVPYGTVEHTIHYHFVENSTDLTNFESDYWIKSGIGLIKATTIPGFDVCELVNVTLPD